MDQKLTDRNFWAAFWESKEDLIFNIEADYVFGKRLGELVQERGYQSAIELGGFPGYYSVFLKKHLGLDVTLFDYFIHQQLIDELLAKNGLAPNDIQVIEADLFTYPAKAEFDLVSSFGLIEHFADTKDIIERHLNFLKPGGTLFITLPNFRGVNGWVQRTFDPENYSKHHIQSMNLTLLKGIAQDLGLKNIKTSYFGGYSIWLENRKKKSAAVRAFIQAIWFVGKVWNKIFPFESKALSPYIILEAQKV
ncbi:MAG: class I SAM-dependent methyltransferase [Sphingobacteriaceae bacterium]